MLKSRRLIYTRGPDRGRAIRGPITPAKGCRIESLHPGFAGLDEKGGLRDLRGQDAEERQHSRLLSTFPPYISSGTRLLSTIEYETNSVSLGDVMLK